MIYTVYSLFRGYAIYYLYIICILFVLFVCFGALCQVHASDMDKRVLFISSYSYGWETVPQQIEGTVAEQTVEVFRLRPRVAGEVLTFPVGEAGISGRHGGSPGPRHVGGEAGEDSVGLAAGQHRPGGQGVGRGARNKAGRLGPGYRRTGRVADLPVVRIAGQAGGGGGVVAHVLGEAVENHGRLLPGDGLIHPPKHADVNIGDNALVGRPDGGVAAAGGIHVVEDGEEHIPGELAAVGDHAVGDVEDAAVAVVPLDGLGLRRDHLADIIGAAVVVVIVPVGVGDVHLHVAGGHGEGVFVGVAFGEAQLPVGVQVDHGQPIQLVVAPGPELNGHPGARGGGPVAHIEPAAGDAAGGVDAVFVLVRGVLAVLGPVGVDGGILLEGSL